MSGGYKQQPSSVRTDGKRKAGKLVFPPPGSGGRDPHMKERDLDFIPESVGGREPQPAGSHIHDRARTGTSVGKATALVDSNAKVTGQAWYGDDVRLPNECIGKILRSPHHYARIKSIDTSKVEALPGVLAVATGKDAPQSFGVLPVTKDEHAMALDKVRHVGDLVACVAAVDEATAIQALSLFEVEWEELEPIFDPKKGLEDHDEPIHWRGKYHLESTNVQKRVYQEFGDRSLIENPHASSYGKWSMEGVHHGFTEPHAVVAHWDPNGRLQLYTPQQVPHYTHRALATVLEVPMHQINVIRTFVGGGFGGKSDPFPHEMCAAILARKSGRPVRITFDREEVYWINRGRHPSHIEVGMTSDNDGRITGFDIDALIDGGGFASFGHVTSYYNGVLATAPYELGSFHYTGARVWTNKPASGAMRGHGAVNTRCAVEAGLDELAEQLQVDPITLRCANLLPPHSRTITGFRITSNGMRQALQEVRKQSGWDSKFRQLPLGKGIGVGCGFFISGSGLPIHWDPNKFPHATVHIQVDMDGGVTVHTGAADIGQGSTTAVAQVVSEVLGLPISMIHVRSHESDTSPVDLGSYSSRVTFMNANAAIRAAMEIRDQLLKAAWDILGYHPNVLVINDRRIYYTHDPAVGISYLEALHKAQEDKGALIASGSYRSPPMGGVHKGAAAGLAPAYSFSAYVAEVDVDVETGLIRCTNVWAAHDCGKALNPLAVKGQIIGSCHMGLGQVLSEKMVYGRTGHLQNANLLEYKIPSVHEMPHVEPIIIESCDPEGPFGAKEAGEGPLLPILPAVVNAVYDAIGIRYRDLPLTPDVVYQGIEKAMKKDSIDDPLDLPSPRLQHSAMQKVLEQRAQEHEVRDKKRQTSEDTDAYVNGVLFGFDPNIPLDQQAEGWREATEPEPEQLAALGLAGKAWLKKEQRQMEDGN
ncbi:MAG: xanthine dehydrogenase family protein molybdopterin-binding subunit [archaeon]|nr:xanthine dehydrogenase family protein molybdopterin-binding subunit [archaeon]MDA0843049.1 xanthine dehydrogenase family protein molybdopterin-binding subunit [archaeon]